MGLLFYAFIFVASRAVRRSLYEAAIPWPAPIVQRWGGGVLDFLANR